MNEQPTDPMLVALMRLAEHGITITVTLSVNGTALSGHVIGQQQYLQKVRKQFNSHVHEENWPGLFDILSLFEDVSEESNELYLHLAKAAPQIASGSKEMPKGLWRIKLSEIDGFSFGM